ncbi:hypothetical protein OAU50_03850 [Planctomycetota bacterium]|nr:hypothetical protein [Planctomycetota bacterium]
MNRLILTAAAVLLALPLVAQVEITDTPRRYLSISIDGASKDWDVRPIRITDRLGANLDGGDPIDLKTNVERWDRTGLPKRYNTDAWESAFNRHLGANAPDGGKFWFYMINPNKPYPEGTATVVDERKAHYWVLASSVTVREYPATWLNLFEGYVESREGEERQAAVKDWEAAHSEIIENVDDTPDGFTQEERNEFANFYQAQFVYIRDRNPQQASIYRELAEFHATRRNLDAELSVYLAALRSGVASPDREEFALEVGRITFHRLQLWEEAEWALRQCQNYAEARYLLGLAFIEMGQLDAARTVLGDTITLVTAEDTSVELELSAEEEIGRLNLALAKLEFREGNFGAAETALTAIPEASLYKDAGKVLTCAMLQHRDRGRVAGELPDFEKVRNIMATVSFWTDVQTYANAKNTDFPLNALMAEAMVIYAQTDNHYRNPPKREPRPLKANLEPIRFLTAAKALDPLSAAPYVAEGRLYKIQGHFRTAMLSFQAGLEVDPTNAMAHYQLADLNLKAGMLAVAKDHLSKCLKYEQDFYPAQTMLGEIAMADVERIQGDILIKISAGEPVDYAAELVPPMKQAAAFFTASLDVNPLQPQAKLALATLYLRLSEVVPLTMSDIEDRPEVKKAYLVKARDLSLEMVQALREFASQDRRGVRLTPRDIAEAPPIEAYNILAFATYTLGDYASALSVFREHVEMSGNSAAFADSEKASKYGKSEARLYANEWINRIEQNERQHFEILEFNTDSKGDYFGDWMPSLAPKNDLGFREATKIRGGKLLLGVNQKESNVFSRLELDRPYSTVALFEADFVRVGDELFNRGLQFTKTSSGASGNAEPLVTLFVGVNSDGNIYYETRTYKRENNQLTEKQGDYGIIDPASYGGLPLGKDERLKLAIRRDTTPDKSKLRYWVVINGTEVALDVTEKKLTSHDLRSRDKYKLRCGFFTQASTGVKGSVEIERVRLIYDGGLGGRKK